MGFPSVISMAHQFINATLHSGDIGIDATVGNGVDTVFLAKIIGARGRLFAFDIQQQAIDTAIRRCEREKVDTSNIVWHCRNHAEMLDAIPQSLHGQIGAAMFNLGYLPGGDTSVITTAETTIPAIESALQILRKDGVITVVVYPGHTGGDIEAEAVEYWASNLAPRSAQTMKYACLNAQRRGPYLIAITKR